MDHKVTAYQFDVMELSKSEVRKFVSVGLLEWEETRRKDPLDSLQTGPFKMHCARMCENSHVHDVFSRGEVYTPSTCPF